ncbi:MAG: DUF3857 domain-containing protein [Calditrichaceae bacterium]|nr:DUF3857 domain-containing protein [Calditrichaceae bacterium]
MKNLVFLLIVFFITGLSYLNAEDFIRNLPKDEMLNWLSPERFQNHDAVIILKEQSVFVNEREIFYRGLELRGKSTMTNKVLIVKLFNDAAVERYGSYEHEYYEWFGDEIPNGIEVKVRVLKPDKSIWVMPDDNAQIIVSRRNKSGDPITRKLLFKIPNLAVGDILQIEEKFTEVFIRSYSGLFFYNDRDLVLYSNLYLTFPFKEEVNFLSFPASQIGEPTIQQVSQSYGSGKTYFWSVRDLNPIPDEPYSRPFAEQSLLTAFVVKSSDHISLGEWQRTVKNFYKDFLEDDEVDPDQFEAIGFSTSYKDSVITWETVDKLYTALRKHIVLSGFNSLYPQSEDINYILETKKGDASDAAYIMYKILQQWRQSVNIVWVRDRREGIFEFSVPSRLWFDRIAVKVVIKDQTRYYDFDRSIPYQYETPWFINPIDVLTIEKEGFKKERIQKFPNMYENRFTESHVLTFDEQFKLSDSLIVNYTGSAAQDFRGEHYAEETDEIVSFINDDIGKTCLSKCDTIVVNDFFYNRDINMRLAGKSAVAVDNIEDKYVFSVKNCNLARFYKKIFAVARRGDIVFHSPFEIIMQWNIKLPEGYSVSKDNLAKKQFLGPANAYSELDLKVEKNVLNIKAGIHFPQMYIPCNQYPVLIKFLDDNIQTLEQNIILTQS